MSDLGEEINITLVPSLANSEIRVIDEAEALEQGEAQFQISEGCTYEYLIQGNYFLQEIEGVVTVSKLNTHAGRITPNFYVGTLPINVLHSDSSEVAGVFKLEVQSTKTSYREDYRRMLEDIAEKCSDLILQINSPVFQNFTPDFAKDSETAYQRFAFIKSVIDSDEFESAVHKVLTSPTTRWKFSSANKSINSVKRMDRKLIRQVATSTQRINLPGGHALKSLVSSVPRSVQVTSKVETVDTAENRFIKFALETFVTLCSDFGHLKSNTRVKEEANKLEEKLQRHLESDLFKEVSVLTAIPLNNSVLQRKEGYREISRAWILFDLAAKLSWQGGQEVYSGNKRDVATLYEYWLFFQLIEIVTEVFNLKHPDPELLLNVTADGFGLKLRQGEYLPICGVSDSGSRKLHVQLSYNRTYQGDQPYPKAGSWSRNLRPDYTLTLWPFGVGEDQAEEEELIVHIHFDAKYKVEFFTDILADTVQLDQEKNEQRKGTYKRADLLKMHAYKDAIRRTAGASIIYPGDDHPKLKNGFHELIPGLGAFAIRPSQADNGVVELKSFLTDIALNLNNRASQREKISFKTYDTFKHSYATELRALLPEAFGNNRHFIPDEIFVLVGYYKNDRHLKWIERECLYNVRTGSVRGSLHLSPRATGAKYLLLHSDEETETSKLYKLSDKGPTLFSKADIVRKNYPSIPTSEFYLMYDLIGSPEREFVNKVWDIKNLKDYKSFRQSGLPIAVTLTELMTTIVE